MIGLGQTGAFTEGALQAKLAQLAAVRAEADVVEAELQAVRSGRAAPRRPQVADGPGRIQVPAGAPPPELPGGYVDLPLIGRVPTLALVAGAVSAAMFWRKRK